MDKYIFHKFFLHFKNKDTENQYSSSIIDKTMIFNRIAWAIVIVFPVIFMFLDDQEFGSKAGIVLAGRLVLMLVGLIMIILSFISKMKKYFDKSSFVFIIFMGIFSLFLMMLHDTTHFTPYFTSFFFAFSGVFVTAGLGFRYNIIAMVIVFIVFEVCVLFIFTIPIRQLVLYNFFLPGIIFVFSYASYISEVVSRENFVAARKLQESLDEIETLNGLLPICSSCKKIRDDNGYWNQVEEYIEKHSHAEFTHSLCPDCVDELYPQLSIKKKK